MGLPSGRLQSLYFLIFKICLDCSCCDLSYSCWSFYSNIHIRSIVRETIWIYSFLHIWIRSVIDRNVCDHRCCRSGVKCDENNFGLCYRFWAYRLGHLFDASSCMCAIFLCYWEYFEYFFLWFATWYERIALYASFKKHFNVQYGRKWYYEQEFSLSDQRLYS